MVGCGRYRQLNGQAGGRVPRPWSAVSCVGLSHDQNVVEDFASDAAKDSFTVGVHPGRLRRTLDHPEFFGLEDGVERLAVLAVDRVAGSAGTRCVPRSAARFLACCVVHAWVEWAVTPVMCGCLVPCWRKAQRVEPLAERGVDVEEVRRDDAFGLGGEELAPGRAGAAWRRIDTCRMQDLPNGRRRTTRRCQRAGCRGRGG